MTDYEPPANGDTEPFLEPGEGTELDNPAEPDDPAEISDTAESEETPAFGVPALTNDERDDPVPSAETTFTDDQLVSAAAAPSFGDTGGIEDPSPAAGEPSLEPETSNPSPAAGEPSLEPEPSNPSPTDPAAAGFYPPPNDPPPADPPPADPPPNNPSAAGQYPPPPVRRLYRSRDDRKVGGVSAGLAEHFRVDPTLVRLGTILFLFTGIGIFAYLIAWLIIPIRPEGQLTSQPVRSPADERTMTIAFGVAAIAIAFGIATGSWAILSLALIGGGIWLLSEHTSVAPGPVVPAGPGMATNQAPPSAYADTQWSAQPFADPANYEPAAPSPPAAPAPVPTRPRQRQTVTWTVFSLLALVAAVGVAAASGDWWDVSATRFLGIGVVIIGIGVVVGQIRRGGARGLIPLGILAAVALFPVSAVDGLLDDGIGESFHRPTDFSELSTSYQHGIGSMTVDLSRLDFEGRSETIDIELGIGELIVIVSDGTGGEAVLDVTAGEVSHELTQSNSLVFEEGLNVETGIVQLEGSNGTLDLNISVGIGTAELLTRGN